MLVKEDVENGVTTNTDQIDGQTFTLSSGDGFTLTIDTSVQDQVTIVSEGFMGSSPSLGSRITVSYVVPIEVHSVFSYGLFSEADITLNNHATINGDVGSNGTNVDAGSGVVINGDLDLDQGLPMDSVSLPSGGTADTLDLRNNDTKTFTAGTYRLPELLIQNNAQAFISGDVVFYVTGTMEIKNNAQLIIQSGASLTIYVDDEIKLSNNCILNQTGSAGGLTIVGTENCTNVEVENNTAFKGLLYVPDADVLIENNSQMTGCVVAGSIEAENNAVITYDDSVNIPGEIDGGVATFGERTLFL